jgi:hypothetical protein
MGDECRIKKGHPRRRNGHKGLARWALIVVVGTACGSADDNFAAETSDEYNEPLGEVTIGEPGGIVTTFPAQEGFVAEDVDGGVGSADAGTGIEGGPGKAGAGGSGGFAGAGTGGGPIGSGGSFGGSTVGVGGSGGFAGSRPPPDGGVGGFGPSGFWRFDDCSPTSNFLLDSSGNGAHAQHALNRTCAEGISGLAVQFNDKKDIVQVADQPQFTVGPRVAVAAWVNPTAIDKDHPIVLKRLNNKTAFSLGIHKGNLEMSVVLTTGKTFISRAPIEANTWTHVGGMYDGRFVFLFMNGEQVGQVAAAGTLRNVFAPLRIGATTETQHFKGIIDEVWLSTNAVSKEEVMALSCIRRPTTFAVSPTKGGPVPFETPVNYQVSVMNNDIGRCAPTPYRMFVNVFGFVEEAALAGAADDGGMPPGAGGAAGAFTTGGAGGGFAGGPGTTTTTGGPVGAGGTFGTGGAPGAGGVGGNSTFDGGRAGSFGGGPIVDGGRAGSFGEGGVPPAPPNAGIRATVNPFLLQLAAGTSGSFSVDVIASEEAEPGLHRLPFFLSSGPPRFEFFNGELLFELAEPTGCFVRSRREIMITSPSVVDDPVRTTFNMGVPTDRPESRGVWTFGRLVRDMARTPEDAPALAENLFRTWLTDQTVNGFTVFARPAIQQVVLNNWPRTPEGVLDLDRAPLMLQAIVNRIDVRNLAQGNAGEGRFVFAVVGPFGVEQFTVILEYKLPAETEEDVLEWANLWHGLSEHPFPSESYNAALEALTLRFSGRNAAPARVNGSALSQLRTNEISLVPRWEFREFVLSEATGRLEETTVKLTPDLGFNQTQALADFVNQNQEAIRAEQHVVPEQFQGQAFLAGSVFNDLIFWSAPGIFDNEARHKLSLNTCNGCHGPETGTTFLQISPRFGQGGEAFLSPFLTGTVVFDPFTGQQRPLNDLARRKADLTGLVCPPTTATLRAASAETTSVAKGIQRVH